LDSNAASQDEFKEDHSEMQALWPFDYKSLLAYNLCQKKGAPLAKD